MSGEKDNLHFTEIDSKTMYGELAENEEFVNTYESLKESLMQFETILDQLLPMSEHYDTMSLQNKIDYDIFMTYAMNTLHYINLRIMGIDPSTNPIGHELNRVKKAMLKWQEIKDKPKRPTVDIKVAKRFIRSGLYDSREPPNKKTKFSDN